MKLLENNDKVRVISEYMPPPGLVLLEVHKSLYIQ